MEIVQSEGVIGSCATVRPPRGTADSVGNIGHAIRRGRGRGHQATQEKEAQQEEEIEVAGERGKWICHLHGSRRAETGLRKKMMRRDEMAGLEDAGG
jgi:hypothetical protein